MLKSIDKTKILVIMTGSIACYKACNLLSKLVQANFDVQVVATPSALQFVGNSTFEGLTGKPAISDLHAAGNVMDHIHLMRWADAIVVAPATANFVNKAAQGVADDLVQTLFMAHDFKKPFLVAPAMNTSMYTHPLTQKSLKTLKEIGLTLLEPNAGTLACGEIGQGKLIEPEDIFQTLLAQLRSSQDDLAQNRNSQKISLPKILITAGGTQEPIDDVRVLSNTSSGRTGVTLATHLSDLGFDITLLQSANSPAAPSDVTSDRFTSFASLEQKLQQTLGSQNFDWIVHAAAVSDYSLDYIEMDGSKISQTHKISSSGEHMSLHLKRNPKLIEKIKTYSQNKNIKVVGFKLTSQATPEEQKTAVSKVLKNADICVHNDTTYINGTSGKHEFNFYHSTEQSQHLGSVYDLVTALANTFKGRDL